MFTNFNSIIGKVKVTTYYDKNKKIFVLNPKQGKLLGSHYLHGLILGFIIMTVYLFAIIV